MDSLAYFGDKGSSAVLYSESEEKGQMFLECVLGTGSAVIFSSALAAGSTPV